jgi:hypothetical protein
MDRFDGTNQSGVFRVKYTRSFYYMLTDPQHGQAEYPSPLDKKWKDSVDTAAADVLRQLVALPGVVPARYSTRSTSHSLTTLFSALTLQHFNFNEDLPALNSPTTTTQSAGCALYTSTSDRHQLGEAREDPNEERLRDDGDTLPLYYYQL